MNYLWLKGTEVDAGDDPMELIGIEGRVGLIERLDVGYMRTIDISSYMKDEDKGVNMNIFDFKFHFIERKKLDASLQFMWGDLADFKDDDHLWVNSLIISTGVDKDYYRLFVNYKIDFYDEDIQLIPTWLFNPDNDFKAYLKVMTFGVEIPNTTGFYPVLEIGRYYSNDLGDGLNVFNVGVNYYLE